jgi:hypothetical protein
MNGQESRERMEAASFQKNSASAKDKLELCQTSGQSQIFPLDGISAFFLW